MSEKTIKDLIIEKLKNFFSHLKSILPNNPQLDTLINQFENAPIEFIITYIENEIYPYRMEEEFLIIKICNNYGINTSILTQENKEKIKKYINFFCEIIEEIIK